LKGHFFKTFRNLTICSANIFFQHCRRVVGPLVKDAIDATARADPAPCKDLGCNRVLLLWCNCGETAAANDGSGIAWRYL
jgi:hypothetical protein